MSVKHIREYYSTIATQYLVMKDTLKQLEESAKEDEEVAKNMLQNITNIRQQVNLLKSNYDRISYLIYLLDMPNKKEKKKKYRNRIKLNIDTKDTAESVKQENDDIINNIKNMANKEK